MPGAEVGPPGPDGQQRDVHEPRQASKLRELARVAREIHPGSGIEQVADRLGPCPAGRHPVACSDGGDGQGTHRDAFTSFDLDDLFAVPTVASDGPARAEPRRVACR